VRLVRLGNETSRVGADVRAALASWGRGEGVVGGVALLGCTPPECPEPVDAILILPRGLIVVVGVDLPDPAMRLDAPVGGQWKIDGWPLIRGDGAVNPAIEGLRAATAVATRLQAQRVEPMPVGTVIAVGPYVSRVSQPTTDLARGIRILHPEPTTLLTATRELAVYERRCAVDRANAVLAALAPNHPPFSPEDLVPEGFDHITGQGLGGASTILIPRVPRAAGPPRPVPTARLGRKRHSWLPVGAALLVGLLLITGIIVAIAASSDTPRTSPGTTPSVTAAQQTGPVINGVTYMPKGIAKDTDCSARAFGDIQAWLQTHPCTTLVRTRYETTVGKDPVAMLVSDLTFPDATVAAEFLKVATTPGTGSITDPSTDGTAWPDGRRPIFDSAAYQTKQVGTLVRIVQAVWLEKSTSPEDVALLNTATQALGLPPS
jgi:hypothetical protein